MNIRLGTIMIKQTRWQGNGDSKVGDVVARDGSGGQKQKDQEKGKEQGMRLGKIIMKLKSLFWN